MKCKDLHNKLIFYLEGDLPQNEMEQVKIHLGNCADCEAFAEEMDKTLGVLEAEKSPEINPFFYTRLKAKMELHSESKVGNPLLVRVLQPALFSLLLLAGIYSGIKIGQKAEDQLYATNNADEQVIPYLNEMEAEPIEAFLME
mgnify:CR=1 FL=1